MSINSKGDTIIEVLIACAIAGIVIAGAFVTVNRSLHNSRQAQEHEEALKIAESQLEAMRGLSGNAALFSAPTQFCIRNLTTTPERVAFGNAAYNTSRIDDSTYYPADCQQTSLGGFKYNVSIHATSADPNRFYVNVDWYGATGKRDNVGLIYKLYES